MCDTARQFDDYQDQFLPAVPRDAPRQVAQSRGRHSHSPLDLRQVFSGTSPPELSRPHHEMRTVAIDDPVAWASISLSVCLSVCHGATCSLSQ